MANFNERAASMNLDITGAHKGLYSYVDRFSEVVYRELFTGEENIANEITNDDIHLTDLVRVPKLGVFTKGPNPENGPDGDYEYVGVVSNLYSFVGNDILIQKIKESIENTGTPILEENNLLNYKLTSLRSEIIIRSSQSHSISGDVLPVIIINNSYDGTKAASISFGLSMNHNRERLIFAFTLGELKQIHIDNSNTSIEAPIETYLETFSENIGAMITNSFNTQLTEEGMLYSLSVIEDISKNRKKSISHLLKEMLPDVVEGQPMPLPSSWQVFLAIVRYSSFETNLNVKRMLENAAQSALVIPGRMLDVFKRISAGRTT